MNCREFEDRWNDLLDARSSPPEGLEPSLEAHASACEPCRAISGRYQLLRQAVSALRPPNPSPGSVERLYRLTVPSVRPAARLEPSRRVARRRPSLATAAAVFVLAWLAGGIRPSSVITEPRVPDARSSATPGRSLDRALAEATEATLDLAREASASASRIGREVLDLGRGSPKGAAPPPAPAPESDPATVAVEEPEPASPGVRWSVRERVEAGVKPISGSARHAFRFLLGPAPEPTPTSTPPEQRDSL